MTARTTPPTRRPSVTRTVVREPVAREPRTGPLEFTHTTSSSRELPDETVERHGDPLGDPTQLCAAVAHAAMEAVRGLRPLGQLARFVTPEIFDALHVRAQIRESARRRSGVAPRTQARSRVLHARAVRLTARVAEATVVVDDVDRVRAAAARVEEHRGRWRVVVLEIG
ncbi:Rv3235 family protein [Sanguibacter suaedae]|uniref:Energy transducer TonB n=1 Tax=Sanguibacter suaedae TaxID=2795737 RepID=A0A934IFI1_9MICO|nr:Rv3235 family protein [Sanguibacter suaedae]MBI9116034.1 energy transducer TonB [Sanguibacter suaedae]